MGDLIGMPNDPVLKGINKNAKMWNGLKKSWPSLLGMNFGIAVALWIGCFVKWIRILTREQVNPETWTDCKLYHFMFFFGTHYSSTLLVLMSIEKCFAVYFPLKAKTVCTIKTAKWATGIVGIILAGYNIVQFFDWESHFNKSYGLYECRSIFLLDFGYILLVWILYFIHLDLLF